ncbi:3-oxoacyl-[acyl-carrier-protein] synthase 3 [Acidocella aquatica]|uniref:Beta-ketoacyl-[acyl-carrier-protein] synthase III n=1 Tax=Acidocella aquatica TaxID=1922313 RepID=A0ABQ6A0V8_9PROT|nr:beta-ketoacyl-ACP synthase III [Acidocella aquatica]GLR65809.1 3-oxoacyl-[acyl-carrier-protein] synthase 3 [Acidocella aquatica]
MSEPLRRRAILAGIGTYLPEKIVSNAEMAERVDTSDEWIVERTGIRQRHFAGRHETCAFMGAAAARGALATAGVAPEDVGAIILATSTPDQAFPSTAVHVQGMLGAKNAFGFDIAAACSGFIYGLGIADGMIRSGQADHILVIGSEVYSRILNFADRGTCVLFGDGAGAVLLSARDVAADGPGILSTHLHSDGTLADILYVDGAVGQPDKPGHLVMNGREVFRHAVTLLASAVNEALTANGITSKDIDWLVPHQANRRIIDGVGRKLGMPQERVVVTVDQHANTSAASIPLALAQAINDGRIKPGQLVLLEALGGGLTWGSALLRL